LSFKVPDGIKNALASALATGIVKTLLQPFDTVKTVQQMQRQACNGIVSASCIEAGCGAIQTRKMIIRQSGIGGLWSGIGITVFG